MNPTKIMLISTSLTFGAFLLSFIMLVYMANQRAINRAEDPNVCAMWVSQSVTMATHEVRIANCRLLHPNHF